MNTRPFYILFRQRGQGINLITIKCRLSLQWMCGVSFSWYMFFFLFSLLYILFRSRYYTKNFVLLSFRFSKRYQGQLHVSIFKMFSVLNIFNKYLVVCPIIFFIVEITQGFELTRFWTNGIFIWKSRVYMGSREYILSM